MSSFVINPYLISPAAVGGSGQFVVGGFYTFMVSVDGIEQTSLNGFLFDNEGN